MKKIFLFLLFMISTSVFPQDYYEIQPIMGIPIDSAHRLSRGLVLVPQFQSGSGSVIYDLTFNENDGTLTSMVPLDDWVTTPLGYALAFDGTDDSINFGSASSLDDIEPLSISFWIFPNTGDSGDSIIGKAAAAGTGSWRIFVNSGSGNSVQFIKDISGTDPTASFSGTVIDGEWQHYLFTWNGQNNSSTTDIKFYRNGVEVSPTSTAGGGTLGRSDAALDFTIGGAATDFDGEIAAIYLWGDRILDGEDAMLLFSQQYIIFEKQFSYAWILAAAAAAAVRRRPPIVMP